jgi:predicted nucleic acid-binding protein
VTLLDTGPLVALFDRREPAHERARQAIRRERAAPVTTAPVLTEAFHLLSQASAGSRALREFLRTGGLMVWNFDGRGLLRAIELMETYADQPMDFADASLVVAAEVLGTRRVLTLDERDFAVYRARHGHRALPFQIVRC